MTRTARPRTSAAVREAGIARARFSSAMRREEALRAPEQDGGHQHVDADFGERGRQENAPERVDESDEQCRDEGAAHRADAADDDDDESEDENAIAHADLHGEQRAGHHAGESGKRRAKSEDKGEEPADVDAEGADHHASGGAGGNKTAGPRLDDQHIEKDRHENAGGNDGEAEGRVADARQQRDRAGERGRQRHVQRRGPPQDARHLVEKENETEGAQHLIEVVAAVEGTQGHHLYDQTEPGGGRYATEHAEAEGAPPLLQRAAIILPNPVAPTL